MATAILLYGYLFITPMGKLNGRPNITTVHHIIGQGGGRDKWADVQNKTNKMLLKLLKHEGFNTVYEDKQEPQLQLGVMYYDYKRKQVMSNEARELVEALLGMSKEEFYKQSLLRK